MDLGLDMDKDTVNIKSVSVWWCLKVLSKNLRTFEAEIMKKLKKVLHKKR